MVIPEYVPCVHGKNVIFVVAHKQTFVQQGIDLPFKLAACPAFIGRFQFIILPFVLIGNGYQQLILRPVQLRPQCGRNRVKPVKLSATLQLPNRETAAVFGHDLP